MPPSLAMAATVWGFTPCRGAPIKRGRDACTRVSDPGFVSDAQQADTGVPVTPLWRAGDPQTLTKLGVVSENGKIVR